MVRARRDHITSNYNAQLQIVGGTITIEAGATAARHISANTNSNIFTDHTQLSALNILGSVNIGAFVEATSQANVQMTYSSITGKANVHGLQYNAISNGVVYALGGGATYFPGDSAGVDLLRRPVSAVITSNVLMELRQWQH